MPHVDRTIQQSDPARFMRVIPEARCLLAPVFASLCLLCMVFISIAAGVEAPRCVGECDNNGQVTIDEILRLVNIALGFDPSGTDCSAADANGDGHITVDEILNAVNNALAGCPGNRPPNPLYVSATAGNDTNLGDQTHPLKSVLKAAQLALDGYKIIVAPGTYPGEITTTAVGTPPQGVQFLADTSGTQTGNPAGPVIVDGTGLEAGFKLVNSDGTLIDGFTVIGSTGGNFGILIKSGSDNFMVRNCVVHDNGDDGIHVQDSSNVLIFNNLVYNNSGDGIAMVGSASGSPKGHVINNTIVSNAGHGITFGSSTKASPNGFVRNNIVVNNDTAVSVVGNRINIKVFTSPRSDVGYNEDFDLVFPFTFDTGSPTIKGPHDIDSNPRFVNVSQNDFHLMDTSPAINAGDVLDANLTARLAMGTTTGMVLDSDGHLDLGYHFAAGPGIPACAGQGQHCDDITIFCCSPLICVGGDVCE